MAEGTFNAGLLSTEAGTLGRFTGNLLLSVAGRITGLDNPQEACSPTLVRPHSQMPKLALVWGLWHAACSDIPDQPCVCMCCGALSSKKHFESMMTGCKQNGLELKSSKVGFEPKGCKCQKVQCA